MIKIYLAAVTIIDVRNLILVTVTNIDDENFFWLPVTKKVLPYR